MANEEPDNDDGRDLFDVELGQTGEVTEADLAGLTAAQIGEMVLMPTDWTVGVLVDLLQRGKIDLQPKFQRRVAWNPAKMSKFIESLFLSLPVPQVVLAEIKPGNYIVIDGKQRLSSLMFFAISDQAGGTLRLNGCEYRVDLNKKTIQELRGNDQFLDDLDRFESQTIRTTVIKRWPSEDVLYLLFLRLNQVSVTLSPQELRRAMHPGEFYNWLDDWTSSSKALLHILPKIPDFRMRDMEIALRFLAFYFGYKDYSGNMKTFLDDTSKFLSSNWPEQKSGAEAALSEMNAAILATEKIFGRDCFKVWASDRFQPTKNRAVFDIMTFYFANETLRDRALSRAEAVVSAFKGLSSDDPMFVRFLQSSTKTVEATSGRFEKWGKALSAAIEMPVEIPRIDVEA